MELVFSNDEIEILIELIYLGNWLANATRMPKERMQKYDVFFEKIKNDINSKSEQNIENETLHDGLESLIEQYNVEMLPSVFAKAYADYNIPYDRNIIYQDKEKFRKSFISNSALRTECEKEIRTNSFKNIQIALSELKKIENDI